MNYTLRYAGEHGTFSFGADSGFIVEHFSDPTGQCVAFTTSAGIYGVGQKIEAASVSPKSFTISGTISGAAAHQKQRLLTAFAPQTRGTLIFDDTYQIDVAVQNSPTIESYDTNPRFSLMLFAAFPYWRDTTSQTTALIGLIKKHRFPLTIGPHTFAVKTEAQFVNVFNDGSVPGRWVLELRADAPLVNPMIQNVRTGEIVRVNRAMDTGERIVIDTTGAELTVTGYTPDNTRYDAFRYLDIDSVPFPLAVGDNLIKADAGAHRAGLTAILSVCAYRAGVTP